MLLLKSPNSTLKPPNFISRLVTCSAAVARPGARSAFIKICSAALTCLWPSAIDLARQLSRHNAADYHKDIAHFYCEQAEEALQHQRVPEARAALKHAL